MLVSDIPIRKNGQDIESSWFNTIRSVLVEYLTNENPDELSTDIINNQSSYQNVTGLVFDKDLNHDYVCFYTVYRKTDDFEKLETGYLYASFKPIAETWSMTRVSVNGDDALNITDSLAVIPSNGQVRYKSDDLTGDNYEGTIVFKFITTNRKQGI